MTLHIAEVFKRISDAEAKLERELTSVRDDLHNIVNRISRAEKDCYQTTTDLHEEVKKHGVQ